LRRARSSGGRSITIRSIVSNDICWNATGDERKLEEIVADVLREIDEDCAWAESSPMPEASRRRTEF
jgi:hypothetical protein